MAMPVIKKGVQSRPLRTLVYGPEGVGKSSFLMGAPRPIFLGSEDGLSHLGPDRVEVVTWAETLEFLRWLRNEKHDYGSLAVDTLDWLEAKIIEYVCRRDHGSYREGRKKPLETVVDGKPDINGYGYGEGYTVLLAEWRAFIFECDRLRDERGMHIIMASHLGTSKVRRTGDDDFSEDGPNISGKAQKLFVEWCDDVMLADFGRVTVETPDPNDRSKRLKVVSDNTRWLHTAKTGAHKAKNRWRLPEKLPLSWDEYYAKVELYRTSQNMVVDEVMATIEEKLVALGDAAVTSKVRVALQSVGKDIVRLVDISNKLSAKLSPKGATASAVATSSQAQ